jgi:hypothetical protein
VIGQELARLDGGSLDILAEDDDTYYSVEVQLGARRPVPQFPRVRLRAHSGAAV